MQGRLCLLLLTAVPAFGVSVGETYEQVVSEKGAPAGSMDTGTFRILTYPDVIIKMKDKIVVSFREPDKTQMELTHPAPPPPVETTAVWETEFSSALRLAKARNCHVLIVYTGSDWSPWCQKMDAEVYSQPEFGKYSREKFVLLKLDYLRHTPMSVAAFTQNDELAQRYNVTSFPNVVIIDASGKLLGRLSGYREGGPANFIRMVKRFE
jgi:thiol-disulfide isomerase/thioredoxin